MRIIFLLVFICILVPSCGFDSNISDDQRFSSIVGRHATTKVPLNLYEPDDSSPRNGSFYHLTPARLEYKKLLGIIEPGAIVTFERAMLERGGGGDFERLEGAVEYNGKTFPMKYSLGLITYYPNSWRIVYRDFDIDSR